jgi:hypothetical protein
MGPTNHGHYKDHVVPRVESYYGLAALEGDALERKMEALFLEESYLYAVSPIPSYCETF